MPEADGLSVVADALADSLAAMDGSAEAAVEGEVELLPEQAARTAPATANVKPRRMRVERVIGPPKLQGPGRAAAPQDARGHGRADGRCLGMPRRMPARITEPSRLAEGAVTKPTLRCPRSVHSSVRAGRSEAGPGHHQHEAHGRDEEEPDGAGRGRSS